MLIDSSSLRLEQSVMVGTDAPLGGGLYIHQDQVTVVTNSILAYNARYNLFLNHRANGEGCEGCLQVEGSTVVTMGMGESGRVSRRDQC